jgi:hypothetical protein
LFRIEGTARLGGSSGSTNWGGGWNVLLRSREGKPKPLDLAVDIKRCETTSREIKDGKERVKVERIDLPNDLADAYPVYYLGLNSWLPVQPVPYFVLFRLTIVKWRNMTHGSH